jgi:hypothetical protein
MRRAAGTGHQRGASRRRPGPTPGLANPHPIGDGVHEPRVGWITPDVLDDSERRLRRYFRDRRTDLVKRADEPTAHAIRRVGKLAREAVEETGAAWWCGLELVWIEKIRWKESPPWEWLDSKRTYLRFWAAPHVGPEPPRKRAAHGLPWLDTSGTPNRLRVWNKHSKTWAVLFDVGPELACQPRLLFEWAWELFQPADRFSSNWVRIEPRLREIAERLFAEGGLGRAGRSGRPAYLACAVLGAMLQVPTERLSDSLNHYRRTHGKAPRK